MGQIKFKNIITRTHYNISREGTNNTFFYLASTLPFEDRNKIIPQKLRPFMDLSSDIITFYDYKKRLHIYDRQFQICIVSLCSDIEFFFKNLFDHCGYKKGKGKGFYQRFEDVIICLQTYGISFDKIKNEIERLKMAFLIRHICVHNLGCVDMDFNKKIGQNIPIGTIFIIDQEMYRTMYDSYVALLKTIDENLES